MRGPLIFGLSEDQKKTIAVGPEAFITYRLCYQCKHCGKQSVKLSVEEKPLPREYVEDEKEKTDYDAHLEEEQMREKEYSGE